MNRPGFYFCICPDSQLTRQRIAALLAREKAIPAAQWERLVFWGDEPLPDQFWQELTLQGLFATPKLLIVRNAHALPAANWRSLSSSLAKVQKTVWPFFCLELPFERGQAKIPAHVSKLPCWEFAHKQGWVWNSPGLTDTTVRSFIQEEAKRLGLRLEPAVFDALLRNQPKDATALTGVLEQLALATASDGLVRMHMLHLVGHMPEFDVFSFLRAVQNSANPANFATIWQRIVHEQQTQDSIVFGFLAMLLREARILWQLHAGEIVRLPSNVLGAKKALAASLGFSGLARIWDVALVAEKGIKSGERSPEQALEHLIAELCRLFKVNQAQRAIK